MGGQCPPAPSAPTPLGLVWFLYRHIDSLQWPPHIIQIWKLPLLSSLKIIDEISGPKAFFYCIVNVGLVYSGGEFLLSIHEASCWKVFYLISLVERKYFCRNLKFERKVIVTQWGHFFTDELLKSGLITWDTFNLVHILKKINKMRDSYLFNFWGWDHIKIPSEINPPNDLSR